MLCNRGMVCLQSYLLHIDSKDRRICVAFSTAGGKRHWLETYGLPELFVDLGPLSNSQGFSEASNCRFQDHVSSETC